METVLRTTQEMKARIFETDLNKAKSRLVGEYNKKKRREDRKRKTDR